MSSRYGFLCFFLFCIVLLLAFKNYEIWSHPFEWVAKKEAMKKAEAKTESLATDGLREPSSHESILGIAEQNIFNPDRTEFPLVRPQVILYGVMITDNYQTASVVNPGRPLHKGEREIKTLKLGDQIGDYKLTRISPDRITLETKEDSFEVLLFDPRFPKRRTEMKTPTKPTELTSPLPVPVPVPPPIPAAPRPTLPPAPPGAPEPRRESVIVTPAPRPVTPTPIPDPGIWTGRRPVRPGAPAESRGN
jgi:type II secretory pathway component PulC